MRVNHISELTDDLVPIVDAFLHSDPFINAYAIWDLHYLRHKTKFFVYLDNGTLAGLLMDYLSDAGIHFIWLWGEVDAVKKLLNIPLPDKMIFFIFPEYENIVRQKFPITAKYQVIFMLLQRGQENLQIRHEVRRLDLKDAYSLVSLRKEKPSEEEIKGAERKLKEQACYGIFIDSTLVSTACIQVRLPEIWIIGDFYTKPEYRNKGYATSLASFLVKEALKETNHVGLFVRSDNYPAKRVYEKVGFQAYREMYWLDCGTGLIP